MSDGSKQPHGKAQARVRAAPRRHDPPERPEPDPIDAANLDEAFVKALEADFIAFGKRAIEAMRADKPTDYMKIVAALRQKDAGTAADPLREMTDAELDRRIEELARRAGYEIRAVAAPDGEDTPADEGADAD